MAKPRNTTIQNTTKRKRLEKTFVVPRHHAVEEQARVFLRAFDPSDFRSDEERFQVIFSVAMKLLSDSVNPAVERFLNEYPVTPVEVPEPPTGVFDLLGSLYQFLSPKSENLRRGSFYTGPEVADYFVRDLTFTDGQTICDPSCGSGVFLLRSDAGPSQIVGIDNDPVAVFIATTNFFLKFREAQHPAISCQDFFAWKHGSTEKFDYIVANPPYGADIDTSHILMSGVQSGESFSYFIEACSDLLRPDGRARFLVPDSLLNVKRHTDIRDFLLDGTKLTRVERLGKRFEQLVTETHLVEFEVGSTEWVDLISDGVTKLHSDQLKQFKNHIFSYVTNADIEIISKACLADAGIMRSCEYGLGVVVGRSKDALRDSPSESYEPMLTGKEVRPFKLGKPHQFLNFDRSQLQQVAPDRIYRTSPKLVYKTIAKRPIVAVDMSQSLTSNSANIILPGPTGPSAVTMSFILNSSAICYLWKVMFGGVNKIGKEHLRALPFPEVSTQSERKLLKIHKAGIEELDPQTDRFISVALFGFSDEEHQYILDRCIQ